MTASEGKRSGRAHANLIYESAGMLAGIMGCSFETVVMDNEMLGQVLPTVRGIEVSDETLSVEVIAEAAEDPGPFLGHDQSLGLMETEYLYPDLADRSPPEIWEEAGAPDMRIRARERVRELLSTHYHNHIYSKTDTAICKRCPINQETAGTGREKRRQPASANSTLRGPATRLEASRISILTTFPSLSESRMTPGLSSSLSATGTLRNSMRSTSTSASYVTFMVSSNTW